MLKNVLLELFVIYFFELIWLENLNLYLFYELDFEFFCSLYLLIYIFYYSINLKIKN